MLKLATMSLFQSTDEKTTMVDSLLTRLEDNVTKSPKKEALTFLGSGLNGGVIETKLTYENVWQQTEVLALNLLESGIKQGDMYVYINTCFFVFRNQSNYWVRNEVQILIHYSLLLFILHHVIAHIIYPNMKYYINTIDSLVHSTTQGSTRISTVT